MYQKVEIMISNQAILGGAKHPKPKKRKNPSPRDQVLKEVGAELQKRFLEMCDNTPNSYLTGMAYDPENFQNFYMAWKFAVNLTPTQHLKLDSAISIMEDPMEAMDKIVEFGVLHKKTRLNDLERNVYMKPMITGGASKLRKKQVKWQKVEAVLKNAKRVGQEGFNEFLTNYYSQKGRDVVHNIRKSEFQCSKDRRLEPYQNSAIFLGSPKCQFTENILGIAPTGSGKTAVIHNLISLYMHDDRVKLFVAPNKEVQNNFYSQIPDHKTLLAKFVKSYPYSAEMLLTFAPKGAKPFSVHNYKNYVLGVSDIPSERRKRAAQVFGKEAYMPYAPIRSITMDSLTKIFEPIETDHYREFMENLVHRRPCVRERGKGQTGLNDLVTLRHDYGYDQKARKEVNGMVHNPFDNRVIIIDEADRIFEGLGNVKRRMLIHLLKFAVNTKIIALTATPLVKGDETYSTTTSKLLELIKGRHAPRSDPLAARVGETCSNEGFISYFYAFIPPLYPTTIPYLEDTSGRPVLGRIIFSLLRNGNLSRYKEAVKSHRGEDPRALVLDGKYYIYMAYATTKYRDRWAGRPDAMARRNVVKDFEQNSNKLMCLFNTLVQEKELKTAVLFTSGMEAFRTFIQMKHANMYYDLVQGQSTGDRIGFLAEKDTNKKRILRTFNSPDNLRGERMKVICADRKFLIGVDFKNVRRLILVSPPTDASMYLQNVGRALRMCTYAHLPKEEQNVRIDIMVATTDPHRTLSQLEDSATYDGLVDQHVRSANPVLTVDEAALRILLKDVQMYRKRMKTIFKEPSMDKTWIQIPQVNNTKESGDLEVVCSSSGLRRMNPVEDEAEYSGDEIEFQEYNKEKFQGHRVKGPPSDSNDPRTEMEGMQKLVDKKHKAIGKKRHEQEARGIGIKPLEPYIEKLPPLPKQRPVRGDVEEIKVAETQFKNLSIPSIREAELDKYSREMRVPNMPVQTFVYESAKQLGEIKTTMMDYTNALMLARDNYPKVENFGQDDNFDIQIMIAESAKKWIQLAKFYNDNFVGGSMHKWDTVIGVNLYYLKWKNRVYVQYEPNVRVVRPVLFTNLKAWLKSIGDNDLTDLDFHRIYQEMPEFRRPQDRVRYQVAKDGKERKRKVNSDGTVDIMVEIRVPTLVGRFNEVSAQEALRSPEVFRDVVQLYSEILVDHFRVAEGQVQGRLDGKSHLLFHVYRVNEDMLTLEFENNLNLDLLDPDPNENFLIAFKNMDGGVDDYALKPRFNVDASTVTKYIRYAVGSNLPQRDASDKTTKIQRHKDMFKRGIEPYPSAKEILNRNNGNVWIMVGQDNKFRIHDTKVPLPTQATVDPYRSQPKFQEARARSDPYVLLDQVKPWQMTVTKPLASIRSFAVHASDSEWNKFWEACLEVKKEYEEEHIGLGLMHPGKDLYMYTDSEPSLAQFHVNFSINMPQLPREVPREEQKYVRFAEGVKGEAKQEPKQEVQPKQEVRLKQWQVAEGGCAKPGDEVYMLVINTSDIYGKSVGDFAKLLVMIKGGVYDLVHTQWKKDTSAEQSMEEYLKEIAYDTSTLGLSSFSDVTDTLDFTNQETCIRVIVNYTAIKWDTSRSSEKVDMVSLKDFWKLKPQSSILKAIQVNMKGVIDRYVARLG